MRTTRIATLALLIGALLIGSASTQQRRQPPFRGLPWGAPAGPVDPLEPWSLGTGGGRPSLPGAGAAGAGVAVATPDPSVPTPRDPRLDTPPDVSGILGTDSLAADATDVVVLQQILIDSPHHARQLTSLFDAGVTWDSARQLLKLTDVQQYIREYAMDDLAPVLASEIDAMPDSVWSSGHPWRGRTMFFQVLARARRSRGSLPALGEGLDAQERARLAQLHPNLRQPVITGTDNRPGSTPDDNFQDAVITKQEPPVFPADINYEGEVTLIVHIGRQGDVTDVDIESSTSSVFEAAAIEAARTSTYRSALRNGIPEPSTLKITYPFAVPAGSGASEQP